ncbi:CRAL/TRIO domain protein, partial [Apiospora phragmitis]
SSSLLYLVPFVVIGIGGIVAYGTKTTEVAVPETSELLDQLKVDLDIDPEMEGTLGNLTPEEQAKLCELWKLIYQICGVSEDEIAETEAPDNALQPRTDSDGSGQPKKEKRRLGLFKKKDKKGKENTDEKASAVASFDGIKDDDADDKYGQNKVFRETLASRSPESIRHTMWGMIKMDHPDQLLLRFLRARKWDVNKALVMLVSTMKWRQDYKTGTEAQKTFAHDFLMQMRMGKSFEHGIDKDGRPINTIRVRLHKGGDQSQESLERYTIYLIETTRIMLKHPIETGCIIFDMTGFSMANMDYTPIKFMIQTFEANYPESLGVVLVHKAPWIFQVIRGWLDPVVAAKVHFTNNVKELSGFVPMNRIPSELEGEDPWTYQYVEPTPGENAKMKDTATRDKLQAEREALYEEFEAKTLEWIHETDAEKRKTLGTQRDQTSKKLYSSFWQLDPYVRARSLYDRVGVIKGNGEVDHYPAKKASTDALDEKRANGVAAPAVAAQTNADDVD